MGVGPLFGGFMVRFGEVAPFFAVAALTTMNLLVAFVRLPESRPAGCG